MSKTVEKIILKNFKAFREEQIIDFKNNNILIYGNNGAGKSSIFWAIYTFLQSSIKNKAGVDKYFKVFDANDESTHQSLRNVFEAGEKTSYIELTQTNVSVPLTTTPVLCQKTNGTWVQASSSNWRYSELAM